MKEKNLIERFIIFIVFIFFIFGAYFYIHPFRNFVNDALANIKNPEELNNFIKSYGVFAPFIIFLLTLLQAFITIIPLFIVMMASAVVFGLFWGVIISLASQIVAGYIAFKLTKYFGRPFVERFIKYEKLAGLDYFVQSYGKWGVLVARIFPLGSFDLVNFAAGLLNVKDRDFIIGTAVGAVPATLFYGIIGANLLAFESASLYTYLSLAILTVFFIIVGFRIKKHRKDFKKKQYSI